MRACAAVRPAFGAFLVLAVFLGGSGCISRPAARSQPVPATRPAAATQPPASLPSTVPPPTSPPGLPVAETGAVPARLAISTAGQRGVSGECLAQIEAFAELQSGNRVMLGQAAFADSDQLVLVRNAGRSPDGKLLDGRVAAEQPIVLNLLRAPQGCAIRLGGTALPGSAATPGSPLPACTCTALRP